MEVDIEIGKQISLQQITYFKKILEHFQMTCCKPISVPINPNIVNSLFLFKHKLTKP